MARDAHIVLGRIGAAHGIAGAVRLKSYTEPIEAIAGYGPLTAADGRRFEIVDWRAAKGVLIVRFAGIGGRSAAETLNGVDLGIDRERLPETAEDEFYHADLIGLVAVDRSGTAVGTVTAIQDFGAGDLIEIAAGRGSVYLPFTREAVPEIDVAGGRLVVAPPPGLFDDAGEVP